LGLAYLEEGPLAAHLEKGRLVRVLEDWTPPFPGFCLYYPHQRGSAGLRAFIELVRSASVR
jgi:DNA-binding transcriptional LysR family regulator